ncbi:hypothetical protein Pres01_34810 [Metapseudomonas resinovorans]|uniref:DsbA family protein n=1 Tax=Metapseudomonas resinovorans TaxID=53412 RepID=UPI000985089A|nr:thioredoxin domain-containing protein [Pseudomonas resinovorans]GLZ87430.1 hypothetical protein Pres01_34810 [Pseudomonas resinovorans]
MSRRFVVLEIVFVALIAIAAAVLYFDRQVSEEEASTVSTVSTASATEDPATLVRFHSPTFGPSNASVTIVEFFDPSCESCRAMYPFVKKILEENPNDVRLVMRYVLFHKGSEEVARLLETSRKQNLFPQVLEAVLAAQPEWHDDPQVLKAWDAAASAGLDVEKARAEMNSPNINAVLKRDMDDAKKIGIRGTPTFYVNAQPLVELGPEPLRNLVLSEIKRAGN